MMGRRSTSRRLRSSQEPPSSTTLRDPKHQRRTNDSGKLCRPLARIRRSCKENPIRVLIIGAGLSGLGAATELRKYNINPVIIEGRDRIGGRVWTQQGVDLGGAWIHGVDGNPLTSLCRRFGAQLIPTDDCASAGIRMPLFDWDGSPVDPKSDERVEVLFNAALDELTDLAKKMHQSGDLRDRSLGDALHEKLLALKLDDQQQRIWQWHCANLEYANATDLFKLSILHWYQDDAYEFPGRHCLIRQGYQWLAEQLASPCDLRLGHTADLIDYRDQQITVHCTNQVEFQADACIVTVPLGILKADLLKFLPEIPPEKRRIIDSLGFGTLNKVVVSFRTSLWSFGSPTVGYASKRHGQFYMFINVPTDTSGTTIVTLISGACAMAYQKLNDDEIKADVLQALQCIFHPVVVPEPMAFIATRWSADPFALGSYCYLPVGGLPSDIALLGEPLGVEGRLMFAGEATSHQYLASCHGAYMTGIREARRVIDHLVMIGRRLIQVTPDRIASHIVRPHDVVCHMCRLEPEAATEMLGRLIGPFEPENIWVHERCATSSPEAAKLPSGTYVNVYNAICRSRRSRCSLPSCRRKRASIGCHKASCERSYHLPCAWATQWDFDRPDESNVFYCPEHRDPMNRVGLIRAGLPYPACPCPQGRSRCQDCNQCIGQHCQCPSRQVSRPISSQFNI